MPPSTPFEQSVNDCRGIACFLITLSSIVIVLLDVRCLAFWLPGAYELNSEPTGSLGVATSTVFLLYLFVDTVVVLMCKKQFRRPMTAVLVHHCIVGVGVSAFLLPSPPRGFFVYVWGEALTAARLLPSRPRYHARTIIFVLRRILWIFLFCRDSAFFMQTAEIWGLVAATVPPFVAALLFALDVLWWQEHRRARSSKDGEGPARANGSGGRNCRGAASQEERKKLLAGCSSWPNTPSHAPSAGPPLDEESGSLPRAYSVQDLGTV